MDAGVLADDVPDDVREAFEHFEMIDVSHEPKQVKQILTRIARGRCMLCDQKVGEDAVLIIAKQGIISLYCGGACFTDMTINGWLEEQHADLQERVEFRATNERG